MSAQTTMNGPPRWASNGRGMGKDVAGLARDLITLGELQGQLALLDFRDMRARSLLPLVLLTVTLVLGLAAVPVALIGTAWLLVDLAAWPAWAAFLVVSAAALAIAALLGWAGWRGLQSALHALL